MKCSSASLHTCVHTGIPGSGICSFVLIDNAKVDLLGAFSSVCPLAVLFLVGHAQSAVSCICFSVFDSTPAPVALRTSLCQCYCDCTASGYCPEMKGGGMCTASSYCVGVRWGGGGDAQRPVTAWGMCSHSIIVASALLKILGIVCVQLRCPHFTFVRTSL